MKEKKQEGYFPFFINIKGKKAIVIGGGTIASRRISALEQFGCRITVISPWLEPKLEERAINWIPRTYRQGDCEGAFLVVAASDDRQANHLAAEECLEKGILISVADRKEESTFFFPGIVKEENLVIGVTASGQDHAQAARVTKQIKTLLGK